MAITASLLWPRPAEAQAPRPAATVTPPTLRSRADATYPPDAFRDRIEATVGLDLVVGEDGQVVEVRVIAPAGHGFDEAAMDAARRFTFEPARRGGVAIRSGVQLAYEFHLPPPASAAPKAAREAPPAPVLVQEGPGQSTLIVAQQSLGASIQEPEHTAASDSSTGQDQLSLRPRLRAEDLLEAVPGLFTVQHAGGGKAQQYFLRGFDLDHGTDLAFFVDGVPINAVSHAHGQGFSDLHFLIPEVVENIESTKGPYAVRVGDFGTAGSTSLHLADHLDESFARAEVGADHQRGVVVESPNLGDRWRMVLAAEAFNENGPFLHPDRYKRFNGYVKVTRTLDDESELSASLMAYAGSWNMSGLLPARAVCGEGDGTPRPLAYAGTRCLSRWDSVDPSQGGETQRFMALTSYRRQIPEGDLEASVFAVRSNLQIFLNDGIAASFQPAGMQYGSQIEQDDTRTEFGGSARVTKTFKIAGMSVRSTAGLQMRVDAIAGVLHRTEQRQRLDGLPGIPGPIVDSGINQTEIGAYLEADWRPVRWIRFVVGGRADRVDTNVNNESATAIDKVSGYRGATQLSPKASAIAYPTSWLDLFANYGRGFHTNDARTLLAGSVVGQVFVPTGQPPTLIATATGYEVGTTVRPVEGLSFSAVAFLLDLTSEQTIDGDTASTSPGGPTRRYGGELAGRYHFRKEVFVDAAFTVTHARYTDAADIAARTDYVTLAPARTFTAGVGVRKAVGPVTLIGGLAVRSMSDRPATQNAIPVTSNPFPLTATGFTVFNGELGVRYRFIEVGLDLLNIGNTTWREGQFAVKSRLPGEGPSPIQGLSFTPGIPRTLFGHAVGYW
jgi:TonB family protein